MAEVELLESDVVQAEPEIEYDRIELSEKQDSFIFSEAEFSGYGGGVGNGKTLAGCIKTYNHLVENPGALFLIGRRHATDLRDSTQRDFLGLFGEEGTFKEKSSSFKMSNGSEVLFRHLDDLKSLTNLNLSGFWIDQAEEVPGDAFIFLVGRIRRKVNRRQGFITFNMNGHDWIWQRFKKLQNVDGAPLVNPEAYHLVEATSRENTHLPKDYLDRLMSMPKEWVERFVEGSWDTFAGQIFSEWNASIHVINPFPIPSHWERFRVIDHGQNNPTACLWAAANYEGDCFIYQEYYQEKTIVSEHVKNIKQLSYIPTTSGKMIQDEYQLTLIDPSTFAKTREKNGVLFSVADEYFDAGLNVMRAQNDVLAGINRVKEYLRLRPERFHVQLSDSEGQLVKGAPRLYVFSRCTNLIEEIQQYRWKPTKYGADVNNTEAPVKRKDHAVDALRYFIMSRPQTPEEKLQLNPNILSNSLELSRYAKSQGLTSADILAELQGKSTAIRHTKSGISHSGEISHESR